MTGGSEGIRRLSDAFAARLSRLMPLCAANGSGESAAVQMSAVAVDGREVAAEIAKANAKYSMRRRAEAKTQRKMQTAKLTQRHLDLMVQSDEISIAQIFVFERSNKQTSIGKQRQAVVIEEPLALSGVYHNIPMGVYEGDQLVEVTHDQNATRTRYAQPSSGAYASSPNVHGG